MELKKEDIVKLYKPADEYFVVNNNDPDLTPIYINLPKPPENVKKIHGYGLHPDDQYFRYEKYPSRLKSLEENIRLDLRKRELSEKAFSVTDQKIIEEIYLRIEAEPEYYEDEVDWIHRQWWHRINGYWFYNKGKPTYIDGWHWFYLNYWTIDETNKDNVRPEYRDRDRRQLLFYKYCYTTTESFNHINNLGIALEGESGDYESIDTGYRTCYGFIQPKNRRGGNTSVALCINYDITTTVLGSLGGIMSYTADNAEEHYQKKLLPSWRKMPFFFRPTWTGNNNPSKELNFVSNKSSLKSLNSKIDFAQTAEGSYYDGKKLHAGLIDESGKVKNVDVHERWRVLKPCFAQGNGSKIHGFVMKPSTVADMEEQGGRPYYQLAEDSKFYERNKISGQTRSGMFRLFFPAYDGLEGFIDKYGMSIISNPTPKQIADGARAIGAEEYLLEERRMLLEKGDPESMAAYRSVIELFPIKYEECFRMGQGSVGWSVEIIDKRLDEIKKTGKRTVRGNFEWENGFGSNVIWCEASETGRWEVSRLFEESKNMKIEDYDVDPITGEQVMVYAPMNPDRFVLGADPIKYNNKQESKMNVGKNRMSDGGMALFWKRDTTVDEDNKMSEWESYRFVCTYRYRSRTDDEFVEDVLKCAIWYGAMVYPETNIEIVWKKFLEWGYGGYLLYDIDADTGRRKDRPGYYTNSKQKIFSCLKQYVEYRCHKEDHENLLLELKYIKGIEEMTKYDLLAAAGIALVGAQSQYSKIISKFNNFDGIDIKDFGF